ncbi:HTH-type transcriptional activator AmpR [Roseovarius litorisediminis]|uniref:HTH-type transcriptional activator AmpR n=1 Tax=Roseovarius litorisediminis TaxID=1312363 RepID=A0A1Y5TG02_9RHOB|nr:LysR family transcriptional regulator [Roseovarius litorisediminis]SLN62871.1 HTH-type transcriptional activator AmpR [Roseovarius litorisediminis]
MNWSGIPSLNSLKAFAALAERSSYSKAAEELNVTHAAVRQQVKALEEYLGLSLAVRQGRGVKITPEGKELARDLADAFNTIRRGIEKLTGEEVSRSVQITTSPAFAVEWLMPRIADFQQRHPDITLMLNPTADIMELRPGGIDVAVRYRHRDSLDKDVSTVLVSDMVVVGAESLLEGRRFDEPGNLVDLPWLQELNTNEVAEWFNRRGVKLSRPLIVSQMPGNLIMQAVRRGDGISYTARGFFQDDIGSGRMRVLHSEPASGVYYIESNPAASRPAVTKFLYWLNSKAETVLG